ncbi:MAG: hypothetical protein JXP36_13930 [Bacteroidales bacterium]|nr:hypothetical protein [Bacteroidales bacterium]
MNGQNANNVVGVDVEYLFKISILLDNCSTSEKDDFPIKDNRLFEAYNKSHTLVLDTLEVSLTGDFYPNYKYKPFKFYKVDIMDDIVNEKDYAKIGGPVAGMNTIYIICVNHATGSVYRLSGFNGNDFKNLLIDLDEVYFKSNKKRISKSSFVKNFHVETIDFKCLYQALKANSRNWKKYRCLYRCVDPVFIR